MFDYAKNMQLALSDVAKRTAMKAVGGVVALIGAGFLLAALWTFLARNLQWGPLGASLAIGLLFVIIAVVLFLMSKKVEHPVPSTDDLKAEVETRLLLARDAALDQAKLKATEVVTDVENRVNAVVDGVAIKAYQFADRAEEKVHDLTHNAAGRAAAKVGLTPRFFSDAQVASDRMTSSNIATIPPLIGAFAVGVALASRLRSDRNTDDEDDYYDEYDDDRYDE